jgi:hypothetical protein
LTIELIFKLLEDEQEVKQEEEEEEEKEKKRIPPFLVSENDWNYRYVYKVRQTNK